MKYEFTKTAAPIGRELYVIPTGDWRTHRPVIDQERCRACGLCTLYCPTCSIRQDGDRFVIDLSYCKGCGICAEECPSDAISMIEEGAKDDE